MKTILSILLLCLSFTGFSFDVGDIATCVLLEQVEGGNLTDGCVTDKEDEDHDFVLVEFFSTTCAPCNKNLPIISKLSTEISDTTTVRLVATDRSVKKVNAYIKKKGKLIKFPVSFDNQRFASKEFGVRTVPTTFLLDKDNKVIFKHSGVFTEANLDKIKELTDNI